MKLNSIIMKNIFYKRNQVSFSTYNPNWKKSRQEKIGKKKINKEIWQNCNAVCFDVDSTVCKEEGIDILANYHGVGKEVTLLTTKAMNGIVKFEDTLYERLHLIKPTESSIKSCLLLHPPQFSEGIEELIYQLKKKKIHIYLVSGGFRCMIEPVAKILKIPKENIYANTLIFDEYGKYKEFDKSEPTSKDHGKAHLLKKLKEQYKYEKIIMIGDGITDLQTKSVGAICIGYGGVIIRDEVASKANYFITHFNQLIESLKDG